MMDEPVAERRNFSPHERSLIDALVASMARGRGEAEAQLADAWCREPEPDSDEDWLTIETSDRAPLIPEEVGDPMLTVYADGVYDGQLILLRSDGRFVSLEWNYRLSAKTPESRLQLPHLDQLVDDGYPPPLVRAAFENDTDRLMSLLRDGVSVQQSQPNGYTALHAALVRENAEAVNVLMDAGADINALDDAGLSPLWRILFRFHKAEIMQGLATRGVDLTDPRHGGPNVLPAAVRTGQSHTVEALVRLGFEPDTTDRYGKSALILAVERGDVESIKVLVKAGADINRIAAGPDGTPTTPAELAAEIGDSALTDALGRS